jgi:hypothetical protein
VEKTPFDAFQADAILFEEAKVSHLNDDGSFNLSLHVSVKMSLIAI